MKKLLALILILFLFRAAAEDAPREYDYVAYPSEGISLTYSGPLHENGWPRGEDYGGKYGFITEEGEVLWEPVWTDAASFSNGVAAVMDENGQWGLIDRTGNLVVDCQYDQIEHDVPGTIIVYKDDQCGTIAPDGSDLIPLGAMYSIEAYPNEEGWVIACARDENENLRYGILDRYGSPVIPMEWDGVEPMCEGLAFVYRRKEGYGVVDDQNRLVLAPTYQHVSWDYPPIYSEGLARVHINYEWGYIDRDGELVIPLQFNHAEPFLGGFAIVMDEYTCKLLDRSGQLISIPDGYKIRENLGGGFIALAEEDEWEPIYVWNARTGEMREEIYDDVLSYGYQIPSYYLLKGLHWYAVQDGEIVETYPRYNPYWEWDVF